MNLNMLINFARENKGGEAVIVYCGGSLWKKVLREVGECHMYSDRTGEDLIITLVPGGEVSDDADFEYWDIPEYTKKILAILGD